MFVRFSSVMFVNCSERQRERREAIIRLYVDEGYMIHGYREKNGSHRLGSDIIRKRFVFNRRRNRGSFSHGGSMRRERDRRHTRSADARETVARNVDLQRQSSREIICYYVFVSNDLSTSTVSL